MSWPLYSLDQLGSVSRGRSRHRPRDAEHLYGGPYPFIQTGDVKHAPMYLKHFSQTYSEAGLAQSKLWPRGTLCITIAANIAETAILDIDACFPDSIIGFVADKDKTNSKFIKYQFDALLKTRMRQVSHGATQDNLSQQKLLSFKFPVPDLPTQEKLVERLSNYDDLIENNLRRIALLEESARLLYSEWFVHFRFPGNKTNASSRIPENVFKKTINDFCTFENGYAFKSTSYDTDGEYRIVTIKNVHEARFVPDAEFRIVSIPQQMPKHCILCERDILLSLTGNVGRACIVHGDGYLLNQRVAKVCPRDEALRPFLYWFFNSKNTQLLLENLSSGTAQLNLSPEKMKSQSIVLPSEDVVLKFCSATEKTFDQILYLWKINLKLSEARDLLLPRLMDGRVAV